MLALRFGVLSMLAMMELSRSLDFFEGVAVVLTDLDDDEAEADDDDECLW